MSSHEHESRRRVGPVTLSELTAGLIWPRLFTAAGMAAQPPRLALGFLTAATILLLGRLFDLVRGPVEVFGRETGLFDYTMSSVGGVFRPLLSMSSWLGLLERPTSVFEGAAAGVDRFFFEMSAVIPTHPWSMAIIALVVVLPAWALGGGALSRMVAMDMAGHYNMGVLEALRFALPRLRSMLVALLVPVGLAVVMSLGMSLVGWIALSPWLSWLGATLYGVMLLGGFLLVLLLVCYAFSQPLIVPALAVEGTDAMDAIQRAFAYFVGRPGRFLIYLLVVLIVGSIAVTAASLIGAGTIGVTAGLSASWLSDDQAARLLPLPDEGPPGYAAKAMAFWADVVRLFVTGYVVSYVFTASTAMYLLLRRVNDEQDISEIWMPGMVGGTMAPIEKPARASSPPEPDASA